MNSSKISLVALVCALLAIGFAAADVIGDQKKLAESERKPSFHEDQIGFDKHTDIFYYEDTAVNDLYSRKNYMATQWTLAGQKPDSSRRAVWPARNPFGVGQRTFKPIGTLMDRWDVRDGESAQYVALYHGNGNAHTVNKVRAHLLRKLANAVDHLLPSLERLAGEDSKERERERDEIMDNIRGTIERVFREVDDNARNTMYDSDDSSATATIAIITDSYVISVGVGGGKIIAYDDQSKTSSLSEYRDDPSLKNVFGAMKSRTDWIHPHVEFYPRQADGESYEFLVLETPALASVLDAETVTRIVTHQIATHRNIAEEEQEIYSGSLVRILNSLEDTTNPIYRFFSHSDYSLILVGLNTQYDKIH